MRVGVGDDGALLRSPAGRELVVATDSIVAGIHFPEDCPPDAIGHRALAVNLSDLAAMGALPSWYTLALALPKLETRWLSAFVRGLDRLARRWNIRLVGGDTVRSPVFSATITVVGTVPRGQALLRRAARPGEWICVTGSLGRAAWGLARWQEGVHRGTGLRPFLYPEPHLSWVPLLRRYARAAIDVSDGLVQDLRHVLEASGVGAVIDLDRIPRDRRDPDALERALYGGDDYELCFTVPETRHAALERSAQRAGLIYSVIGRVTRGRAVSWQRQDGSLVRGIRQRGFDHFAPGAG